MMTQFKAYKLTPIDTREDKENKADAQVLTNDEVKSLLKENFSGTMKLRSLALYAILRRDLSVNRDGTVGYVDTGLPGSTITILFKWVLSRRSSNILRPYDSLRFLELILATRDKRKSIKVVKLLGRRKVQSYRRLLKS